MWWHHRKLGIHQKSKSINIPRREPHYTLKQFQTKNHSLYISGVICQKNSFTVGVAFKDLKKS